ncbi:hypothetical protein MLPF_1954 [Mycobacterium lepromatosis]|nr:hypothetical protein MLPF_1954 [Mycobacterium lepromatosis]
MQNENANPAKPCRLELGLGAATARTGNTPFWGYLTPLVFSQKTVNRVDLLLARKLLIRCCMVLATNVMLWGHSSSFALRKDSVGAGQGGLVNL